MKVKLYGKLRELVDKREVELRLKEGSTIVDAVRKLIDIYGTKVKGVILEHSGDRASPYSRSFFILINGLNINSFKDREKLKLSRGDVISLIPTLSGG